MIAPNKQNLLTLEKQKKSYQNGHKLLKEKRNGLVLSFLELSRRGKKLEQSLSGDLKNFLALYERSLTFVSSNSLLENIESIPSLDLEVKKKRFSGVYIKDLFLKVMTADRLNLRSELRSSLNVFGELFPRLLELVQLKLSCQEVAKEILKTNRQIANIEKKVEEFEATIKWMRATLQEKENLEKSVLIKIFN